MPEKRDPWDLVKAKEDEKGGLIKRWDKDADLIDNAPYTLRDVNGDKEARAFHVTIPNAALYFAKIWALVAGVSRLPTINSVELSDDEKMDIVNFLSDYDYEIDALLNNKGQQSAFVTHAKNLCGRGWTVEQHLSRKGEDGKLLTDVRPLDAYGFTYSSGIYGMRWGCIETLRSKADIEDEFNVTVKDDTGIVKDLWNSKKEIIKVDGEQVDERDNPYGYPPFIVQVVPFGPGLMRRNDTLKGVGESIFYPHRDMFDELNFMASVIKTQAYDDLRPALQKLGTKGPKKYPTSKSILPTDELLQIVPTRGFTAAMQQFMGLIESIIQRAGLSAIDQGTLNFPLSAVALTKMMAVKESLTLPRLQAMSELYQARTRMIIDQVRKFGATIEIGPENTKRRYDTSKLSGPYTITWNYLSESLEDMAAKAAIGNSLKGLLPDNAIRKDILQRENPKADEDALEVQEAKALEPILKLMERTFSLIDEDTKESQAEAWVLHHRITTELKQRVAQGVQPLGAIKPSAPSQQMPIFGRGGRPGGPQPVTKESQPAVEEEGA